VTVPPEQGRDAVPPRTWHVLLIGGGAGVGKSSAAFALARRFGVGLTEVDDFQRILERMTTPELYPAVHAFNQDPAGWRAMSDERKLDAIIAYGEVMALAMEPVLRNHLDGGIPTIYEGDFLLPSFAARPSFGGYPAGGRVRGVFLYDSADQIDLNFQRREGRSQPDRARISQLYGDWLRAEAARHGQLALPARPWEMVVERIIAELDG
jgi:2-phosphoglycerate kinase